MWLVLATRIGIGDKLHKATGQRASTEPQPKLAGGGLSTLVPLTCGFDPRSCSKGASTGRPLSRPRKPQAAAWSSASVHDRDELRPNRSAPSPTTSQAHSV
jgi:hypothetical protein